MQQQQQEPSATTIERRVAQAMRVEQAASEAIALVEKYAEMDPNDENSEWRNPRDIFGQLQEARDKLQRAWEPLEGEEEDAVMEEGHTFDEAKVRALYVEMITDAFADCLEEMRLSEGGVLDVDILVDCLQSGLELLSTAEIDLMVQDQEGDEHDQSHELTPHEKRRGQLGFKNVQEVK